MMFNDFIQLSRGFNDGSIEIANKKLNKIVQNYVFIKISQTFDISQNKKIQQNIKESEIIIIKQYQIKNFKSIITCFYNTVLIICQSSLNLLQPLFSSEFDYNICFLSNVKETFDKNIHINYHEFNINQAYKSELDYFVLGLNLVTEKSFLNNIWLAIRQCISLYLIHQCYQKMKCQNRFELFSNNNYSPELRIIDPSEYIELQIVGKGYSFNAHLIYHIEKEIFLIIKRPNYNATEKIIERETENYLKMNYPLLPKFYGVTKNGNFNIIEYIYGKELSAYTNLNEKDKFTVIFELMLIIQYLHLNNFIYRDLKPNNIIIDDNKTVVLIDFERMLDFKNISSSEKFTNDFSSVYIAPEINSGNFSNKADIFSLGRIIFFILTGKSPNIENVKEIKEFNEYLEIKRIYESCVNENANKRPSISELIIDFFINYYNFIKIENVFIKQEEYFSEIYDEYVIKTLKDLPVKPNDPEIQNSLGVIYSKNKHFKTLIEKQIHYFSLASEQNYAEAQFNLGSIYVKGKYVPIDINKAIHYYTLAANQSHVKAQFYLGVIFSKGKYVPKDINKAIYYYTLAANQNYVKAQFNLGVIYYNSEHDPIDISKAIHYYTLAANQKHAKAQYSLGTIYYFGKHVPTDIDKAIHYLKLSSDQNHVKAQFYLGLIYENGKYIPIDINKAIHYYTLAADKNLVEAQYNLGVLYSNCKLNSFDINKAIHYYTLAANQNYVEAQYNLGKIYYNNDHDPIDINKAIHFYTLAANKNDAKALFHLGVIYYFGKHVPVDIDKSIQYFTLASSQNHVEAQYNLGLIYGKGERVQIDMNKSIHYFTLAANQNHVDAQFSLGVICYNNANDINKAIHYYTLAANQNHVEAQYNLGLIYGKVEPKSINMSKAIYYYTLAANQNHVKAQYNLGVIYAKGERVPIDTNKAIYYFTLAANQNYANAQFNLGLIFCKGERVPIDINKSIYYFTLAANQKHAEAQFYLGVIYDRNKHVPVDMNKSIHYYTQAANQNHAESQFILGLYYQYSHVNIQKSIYYYSLAAEQNYANSQYKLGMMYLNGFGVQKNIKEGKYWIYKASGNEHIESNFMIGCMFHMGKYTEQDIIRAICCYKNASSFKNNYAKNNLGIIYRYGFGQIPKEIGLAKVYFKEAIDEKNDLISMYNLANLLFYEDPIDQIINESIDLLINSSNQGFSQSDDFLCLVLVKKFKLDNLNVERIELNEITNELKKHGNKSKGLPLVLYLKIIYQNLKNNCIFDEKFEIYKNIHFLYDYNKKLIKIPEENAEIQIKPIDISEEFYDGFGNDLLGT